MQTLAILAPIGIDATPAQQARAHRALMEQMMLIARGHAVDSLPVRCAAEMVSSAIAGDPVEFEIVAAEDRVERMSGEAKRMTDEACPAAAASEHREQYRRYLRTIMSGR